MSAENVEAAAMRRDIDRAEQWAAEPYSDDDRRPSRAPKPDADQWCHAWDDDEGHRADMVRAAFSTPPAGDTYPVTHPSTSPGRCLMLTVGVLLSPDMAGIEPRPPVRPRRASGWFVEFDKAPSKVCSPTTWPDVPNYGDDDCRLVHGSA